MGLRVFCPFNGLSCSRSSVACPPDVHQMSCSGSSLPPVSLPRLFHAPLAPKPNLWKRDVGVSAFAARLDFRCRVQSRQLNSLSWMLLGCAGRQRHGVPIEWRGDKTHTRTQTVLQNPLTSHSVGDERTGRKSMSSSCSQSRNVQATFISFRTPITHHTRNPNHSPVTHRSSSSTEVLAN